MIYAFTSWATYMENSIKGGLRDKKYFQDKFPLVTGLALYCKGEETGISLANLLLQKFFEKHSGEQIGKQQDAQEFYQWLLSSLHDEQMQKIEKTPENDWQEVHRGK